MTPLSTSIGFGHRRVRHVMHRARLAFMSALALSLSAAHAIATETREAVEHQVATAIKAVESAIDKGDLERAQHLVVEALATARDRLGEEHLQTLDLLGLSAEIQFEGGNPAGAAKIRADEVARATRRFGADNERTLAARTGYATAITTMGRNADGLRMFRDILETQRRILPAGHADIAHSVANLASVQMRVGLVSEALRNYALGYELRRAALGEKDRTTILSLANWAHGLNTAGRSVEAEPLGRRALELRLEVDGAIHYDTAITRNNYASILERLGRHEEAGQHYEAAARDATAALPADSVDAIKLRSNAALFRSRRGDQVGALKELRLIAESFARTVGATHPYAVDTIFQIGIVLSREGHWAEAYDELEKALKGRLTRSSESHPDVIAARHALGVAASNLGRPAEAREFFSRSLSAIEASQATMQALGPITARAWSARHSETARRWVELELSERNDEAAFALLERVRARVLLDLADQQRLLATTALDATDRALLDDLELKLADAATRLSGAAEGDERTARSVRFAGLVDERKELFERLSERYAGLNSPRLIGVTSVRDASRTLSGSTMLSFLVDRANNVSAAIIKPDGTIRWQRLGRRADLDHMVRGFQLHVSQGTGRDGHFSSETGSPLHIVQSDVDGRPQWRVVEQHRPCTLAETANDTRFVQTLLPDLVLSSAFGVPPTLSSCMPAGARSLTTKVEFDQLARALTSLLIEPLAGELGTAKDLIIVPDRALWGIPWDALRMRGQLLAERFSTSVTHSLSVLTLSRARVEAKHKSADKPRLVAFADAAYKRLSTEDSNSVTRNWRAFRSGNRSFVGSGEVNEEIGRLHWPTLQSSRQEAMRVSRLFPGASELVLGEDVTPTTILRMSSSGALRRYDHVLFSVHGYFDPGTPEYSALMLSPTVPTHTASALFAHQVYGLRLNSRLVFLSACSTGLGQIDTGDGLYGLPYAFLVAGNADTIATLWPVRDRATADFVGAFYRNLRRHDNHRRALWETKRQFARSSNPAMREPSVWAAFTLFGG